MKQIRIIVAGSRGFDNYSLLSSRLDKYMEEMSPVYRKNAEIISGTARGADQLGEKYAEAKGLILKQFPANWDKFGNKAGYLRNKDMAEYASEGIGVLFLFWDGKSKGSKNMLELAHRYELELNVIKY